MPLVSRTRATLRRAEFGFFGVWVNTRTQTPRFCGLSCSAGLFVLLMTFRRPLRTSWLIVGTVTPPADGTRVPRARNPARRSERIGSQPRPARQAPADWLAPGLEDPHPQPGRSWHLEANDPIRVLSSCGAPADSPAGSAHKEAPRLHLDGVEPDRVSRPHQNLASVTQQLPAAQHDRAAPANVPGPAAER